jgi:hypothetical protein
MIPNIGVFFMGIFLSGCCFISTLENMNRNRENRINNLNLVVNHEDNVNQYNRIANDDFYQQMQFHKKYMCMIYRHYYHIVNLKYQKIKYI